MGPPSCSGAAWHVGRTSLQRRSLVTPVSSRWRAWRVHHAARRLPRQLSAAASGSGEGESFNIDELAKRLSQEAEKLRQSGASMDYGAEEEEEEEQEPEAGRRESAPPANLLQPLGYQAAGSQEELLRLVGEAGFLASEFELQEILGQINVQQIERTYDPDDIIPASERISRAAVIAYVAKYYSGLPFQDAVFTMLKEYLPSAATVACNELQVLKYLTGLPEPGRKWSRAKAELTPDPPVAQLLGYFVAGLSEQARDLLDGASMSDAEEGPLSSGAPPDAPESGPLGSGDSTVWVVMKWEGLTPVAIYPSAPQQRSGFGMLWGARDSPFRDRILMLRAICRGALAALAYCHERGVVHGSLGSGSVLLSTFDDRQAQQLVVKLDNFGFARRILPPGSEAGGATPDGGAVLVPQPASLSEDTPLALGQREDLRALAVVLLECLLSALAEGGASPLTAGDSIQRLFGEVFQWDVDGFRQYCADEPAWSTAVAFLDDEEQAGWALVEAMVKGTAAARQLVQARFCLV